MLDPLIDVQKETLLSQVLQWKRQGGRFVTITCLPPRDNRVELIYHFDFDLQLRHLRLVQPAQAPVPSITPVFAAAFLAENEIQDLFGLRFEGLTIDYSRTLYLQPSQTAAPFTVHRTPSASSDEPGASTDSEN